MEARSARWTENNHISLVIIRHNAAYRSAATVHGTNNGLSIMACINLALPAEYRQDT